MEEIVFRPIGVIRSPYLDVDGMPVQPMGAKGVKGRVELNEYLQPGLKDLEGFSHIVLIYYFHLSTGCSLHVLPFLDKTLRGVFATRVPRRPNGIGLSVVKLTGVRGSILDIEEVDVLDGTPLLDIKPFVPQFDNRDVQSAGWFTRRADSATVVRADRRFVRAPDGGADSRECGEVAASSEPLSCEQSGPSPNLQCAPNMGTDEEASPDSCRRVAQGTGRRILD
jgi:tRNA (adenine37-N6)-methyltransferase